MDERETTIKSANAEANASNTYVALFNHYLSSSRPVHDGIGRHTRLSRHSASLTKARERLRTSMIAEQDAWVQQRTS